MKAHDYITQNGFDPVSMFNERPLCLIISSYVNLGALDVNNKYCLKPWVGTDIAF